MTRLARLALLALALSACNTSSASKLDAQPPVARNLVCERVKLLNAKATCEPEMSGEGPSNTYTARVTVEGAKVPEVCGLNVGQLAMFCDVLVVQPQQQEKKAEPEAAKAETAKPASKGAKK